MSIRHKTLPLVLLSALSPTLAYSAACAPGQNHIVRVSFDSQNTVREATLYRNELLLIRFPPPADAFWLDRPRTGPELATLRDDDLGNAISERKSSPQAEKAAVGILAGTTQDDSTIDFVPFIPPNLVLEKSLPEKLTLTVHTLAKERPTPTLLKPSPIPSQPRPGFWHRLFSSEKPLPSGNALPPDCGQP